MFAEKPDTGLGPWLARRRQRPKALGVRFRIEDAASFRLVDPDAVFAAVQRVAKTHRGDKPKLAMKSLEMRPVTEVGAEGGIRVLVSAVTAKEYRAVADFVGEQLFFLARVDAFGLGAVKQLPFFVVHEPGLKEPEMDKEKGILFAPAKSAFWQVQAFTLGGESLALYGSMSWPDSQDVDLQGVGELDNTWILVVGGPAGVALFTKEDFMGVEELPGSGMKLIRTPWLLGLLGNRQLVFDGRCREQGSSSASTYCPWVLSVSP